MALPSSARTIEHFEWLAVGIIEQGGSASVWVARPIGRIDRELVDHGRQSSEDEYAALEREAGEAVNVDPAELRRRLARLRRELRKAEARDYFGARNRARARAAIDRLARGKVTA